MDTRSRAQRARQHQDDVEADLLIVAPSSYMAVGDDDPRRCAPAGLGKLHDIRRDGDGVRRCASCRRTEAALYPLVGRPMRAQGKAEA